MMDNRYSTLLAYLQDPIAALWRILASRRLTVAVVLLLALLISLSLVFPQLSPAVRSDPMAYGRWLAALRQRYGGTADIVRQLGLTDLRGSWLSRLLLAVIALELVTVVAEQLGDWIRTRRDDAWWEAEPPRQIRPLPAEVPECELLPALGALVQEEALELSLSEGSLPAVLRRRASRKALWRIVPHLAALLFLGGLLVNERWGWREEDISLGPGQAYSLAHGDEIVVVNEQMTIQSGHDGTLQGWQTVLLLQRDGQTVGKGIVAPTQPLRYGWLLFTQPALGPAIRLTAQDEQGQPLLVQTLSGADALEQASVLRFRDPGEEGYFALPARNLTFRLTYYEQLPQQGKSGPVFHVQAYRGGQMMPIWEAFLDESATWTLDRMTLTMGRTYYALLTIDFAPGRPLELLGILGVLTGVIALLWQAPRAAVVSFAMCNGRLQSLLYYLGTMPDANAEEWFVRLCTRLALRSDADIPTVCENGRKVL